MDFSKPYFGKEADGLLRNNNRNIKLKENIEVFKTRLSTLDKKISNLYEMAEEGDKEAKGRIAKRRIEKEEVESNLKVLQGQLTEDGLYDSQLNVIYKMISVEDIWLDKKPLVQISDILSKDENRKRLVMVLPNIFSKVTFDFPNQIIEAFDKDERSRGTYSVKEMQGEINSMTAGKGRVEIAFEPPKRTFKARKLTGKVGQIAQQVRPALPQTNNIKQRIKEYIPAANKKSL